MTADLYSLVTSELFLSYLPIPFFLTGLYSFLVIKSPSALALRVRKKCLMLIVWINLFGIPLIFLVGALLFRERFFPEAASTAILPIIRSLQVGILYGAVSSSPVLLLAYFQGAGEDTAQ